LNIGSGEEVWKEHLMSPSGCTKNNRKNLSSNNNNNNSVPEPSKKLNQRK
jgi:hypothetical protein